jgi:hypothetical protein
MTDDQIQSLKDDIAFMKALAQEGRRTPLLGGSVLVSAGLIFGFASLGHWAITADVLAVPGYWLAVLWTIATVAFAIALYVLSGRVARKPGAGSPANQAANAAWAGVGGAVFTLGVALVLISIRLQTEIFSVVIPSLIFALYGAAWVVSGSMARKVWVNWVGYGCWAAAVFVAFFAGDTAQYLIYALCFVFFVTVPGLVLMREEPSDIV